MYIFPHISFTAHKFASIRFVASFFFMKRWVQRLVTQTSYRNNVEEKRSSVTHPSMNYTHIQTFLYCRILIKSEVERI